tara:strand:+ start:31 stop:516 length:486 start_codon:yes stop_codon:yes gene_type:complete
MITKLDLQRLYEWASNTNFPLRKEGITSNHMGYEILICYLKYGKKKIFYPHKSLSESIFDILVKPEIYSLTYIQYPPKLIAKPHRDYNPYGKKFKRIQLPMKISKENKCFIEWIDTNEKIYWEEGKVEIFDVEKLHQGKNDSDETMEFIYVDVNPDTEVEV